MHHKNHTNLQECCLSCSTFKSFKNFWVFSRKMEYGQEAKFNQQMYFGLHNLILIEYVR